VEVLDEICQGLLLPLFDLKEVDAFPPLLAATYELAKRPISQVLETRDASQGAKPLNQDCATPLR